MIENSSDKFVDKYLQSLTAFSFNHDESANENYGAYLGTYLRSGTTIKFYSIGFFYNGRYFKYVNIDGLVISYQSSEVGIHHIQFKYDGEQLTIPFSGGDGKYFDVYSIYPYIRKKVFFSKM